MIERDFAGGIVIKFKNNIHFPYQDEIKMSQFFFHDSIIQWKKLAASFPGISIKRIFSSVTPARIAALVKKARLSDPGYSPPDFFSYYAIRCPQKKRLVELLQILLKDKNIDLAYIQNDPGSSPGIKNATQNNSRQGYLNAAPYGIDAVYAGQFKGGDGTGNVKFIDIEQGWIPNHEAINISTIKNTGLNCIDFYDHGAAVVGIIKMKSHHGLTGITPAAKGTVISEWRPDGSYNVADAIMTAIAHFNFGDILLLETQVSDLPESTYLWPVETEELIFQLIRMATALGIIVIEPAGNGSIGFTAGNNLDQYSSYGKKILRRNSAYVKDSGAIVVAAATAAMPHKRMHYSNYGSRIDCYAWGEQVATAGNHPRSSGLATNTYTENFGGTSAAAAIIAGAAIAVQSIAEANCVKRLGPKKMRAVLSDKLYGTLSIGQQIGVMPDLRKIIDRVLEIQPTKSEKRKRVTDFAG